MTRQQDACDGLIDQVKQNCEMESHEEKLHKMIIQSKINDTKVRHPAHSACRLCLHLTHSAQFLLKP